MVNKDQLKGRAKELGGKLEEEAGRLVGNRKLEQKGLKRAAEGRVQERVGDLEEAAEDAHNV